MTEEEWWKTGYNELSDVVTAIIEKNKDKEHRNAVIMSYWKITENGEIQVDLDAVAVEGQVVFVDDGDDFFGNLTPYRSEIFTNPTWTEVLIAANEMINVTHDFHRVFLENIQDTGLFFTTKDGFVRVYEFSMGS